MCSIGVRLPILAATVWAGLGLSAWAMDLRYAETVYVTPTAGTVVWPTTYVSPRSYVLPTAYVTPTYFPTSYVEEPLVLTSSYRLRRGLFGRLRLVERPAIASYGTIAPTAFYLPSYYTTSYRARVYSPTVYTPTVYAPTVYTPTVYQYPTVWETAYSSPRATECCDQVAWAAPATTAPTQSYLAPPRDSTAPRSSGGSRSVQSQPMDDPTIPSAVDPAPAEDAKTQRNLPQEATKTQTQPGRADNSPTVPNVQREQSTAQPGAANPNTKGANPATPPKPQAPTGDKEELNLSPAPIDNNAPSGRRDSLRPNYSTPTRAARPELRNVLLGRVESDAGEPLDEVPVSVTNRDNAAVRRDAMTNAFGNFAIRLTDGDWTVNVRMPSGRVYPVRSITVSNGKVLDNREGREVRNLIISY
jgi:Carboxypeptidase regulatory-like domain